MTSSPTPDLASLAQQQRLHDSYDYEGKISSLSPTKPQYHFQTSPPISAPSQYTPLAVGQLSLKKPVRSGLPVVSLIAFDLLPCPQTHPLSQQWLEASQDHRSLSPNNTSDFSSSGGSPPLGHLSPNLIPTSANTATPVVSAAMTPNPDDEIIPTAIVIKNIPFNVKRETLLDIIVRPFLLLFSCQI